MRASVSLGRGTSIRKVQETGGQAFSSKRRSPSTRRKEKKKRRGKSLTDSADFLTSDTHQDDTRSKTGKKGDPKVSGDLLDVIA